MSLDLVEINGEEVSLPRTETLTCQDRGDGRHLFAWAGSNTMTPRRPLNDRYSSRIDLSFDDDPPTPQNFDLDLYWRDQPLTIHWPGTGSGGMATLDGTVGRAYTLLGALPANLSGPRRFEIRVQFRC